MAYVVGFAWLVHNGFEETDKLEWFPFCCFAAMGPLMYMLAFVELTSGKKRIGILVSLKKYYRSGYWSSRKLVRVTRVTRVRARAWATVGLGSG